MNHALAINIGIIVVMLVGLFWTRNPLFVLGLFFLRDMPYQLEAMKLGDDDDEPAHPMGFHTQD